MSLDDAYQRAMSDGVAKRLQRGCGYLIDKSASSGFTINVPVRSGRFSLGCTSTCLASATHTVRGLSNVLPVSFFTSWEITCRGWLGWELYRLPLVQEVHFSGVLNFTGRYLADFEAARLQSPDAQALVAAMTKKYPDLALARFLQSAANAAHAIG